MAVDEKQVTVLIGLDLSAAFDTVDHRLIIDRLRLKFGVTATVLDWLQSYLEGRSQFVNIGQHQSPTIGVDVGVPQGSVLVMTIGHAGAVPTVHQDSNRKACIPLHSTSHLELAAKDSYGQ